ncbi:uncharacterized protein [Ptychodera flava]|uniref:uncharacterized protein n=1 Tax=Ptychodera flava TaxID=63121 RepID=UPI003969E15B
MAKRRIETYRLLIAFSSLLLLPKTEAIIPVTISPIGPIILKETPIQLTCSLLPGSQHTANDLVWYYNGEALPKETYKVEDDGVGLLVIDPAEIGHSGTYSCGVAGDDAENVAKTTVTVGTRPDAELSCKSTNHMRVVCSWSEIFSNLPSRAIFSWKPHYEVGDDKYEVCKQTEEDVFDDGGCICSDTHTCYFPQSHGSEHFMRLKLSNALGNNTIVIVFNPDDETVPNKPRNVTATALQTESESKSILVEWLEPVDWHSDLYHLFYKVEYREYLTEKWIESMENRWETDRKKVEVKDLQPFTTYLFRVACLSEYADPESYEDPDAPWSAWSDVAMNTTYQHAPTESVKIIVNQPAESEGNSDRSYVLEWQPLSRRAANGIILGYRIYLWVLNSTLEESATDSPQMDGIDSQKPIKVFDIPQNQTNYKINGLQDDIEYRVDIVAYNIIAESPPASVTIPAVQTKPGMVTDQKKKTAIVVVILLAVLLVLVLAAFAIRYLYRKAEASGCFESVAKVKLDFGDLDSIVSSDKTLLNEVEEYDELKRKPSRSGSKKKNGHVLPVDVNGSCAFYSCSVEYNESSDKHGQYIKLRRGQDSNTCDPKSDDEGLPSAKVEPNVENPSQKTLKQFQPSAVNADGYCQVTGHENVSPPPKAQPRGLQLRGQVKVSGPDDYCQVTDGKVLPLPRQPNRQRTPIVTGGMPKQINNGRGAHVEQHGNHNNQTDTDTPYCQVTSKGVLTVPATRPQTNHVRQNSVNGLKSPKVSSPIPAYCQVGSNGQPVAVVQPSDSGLSSAKRLNGRNITDKNSTPSSIQEATTAKPHAGSIGNNFHSGNKQPSPNDSQGRDSGCIEGGYCQVNQDGQPVMIGNVSGATPANSSGRGDGFRNIQGASQNVNSSPAGAMPSIGRLESSDGSSCSHNRINSGGDQVMETTQSHASNPDYCQISDPPAHAPFQGSGNSHSNSSDYVKDYSQVASGAPTSQQNARTPPTTSDFTVSDYAQVSGSTQQGASTDEMAVSGEQSTESRNESSSRSGSNSSVDDYSQLSQQGRDTTPPSQRTVNVSSPCTSSIDYVEQDSATNCNQVKPTTAFNGSTGVQHRDSEPSHHPVHKNITDGYVDHSTARLQNSPTKQNTNYSTSCTDGNSTKATDAVDKNFSGSSPQQNRISENDISDQMSDYVMQDQLPTMHGPQSNSGIVPAVEQRQNLNYTKDCGKNKPLVFGMRINCDGYVQ